MRKLIFIILVVSFSAIYYYSTSNDENSLVRQTISDVKKMVKNSTLLLAKNASGTGSDEIGVLSASSDMSANQNQHSNENLQGLGPAELIKWIEMESQLMDSTNNEAEEKQIELKAQAQTLEPQQLEVLKNLAINSGLPINSRILSAYLISLNPTAQSQRRLFDVAQSEVPDFGPILPHSEAELKHTQELAIRYMQIDELFQRAKTDADALDKLKLLVHEAQSAQVRSYAQKKINELK